MYELWAVKYFKMASKPCLSVTRVDVVKFINIHSCAGIKVFLLLNWLSFKVMFPQHALKRFPKARFTAFFVVHVQHINLKYHVKFRPTCNLSILLFLHKIF